jgi:hypothetical protein
MPLHVFWFSVFLEGLGTCRFVENWPIRKLIALLKQGHADIHASHVHKFVPFDKPPIAKTLLLPEKFAVTKATLLVPIGDRITNTNPNLNRNPVATICKIRTHSAPSRGGGGGVRQGGVWGGKCFAVQKDNDVRRKGFGDVAGESN